MWRCSQDVAVLLDYSVQYSLRSMDRGNGVLANWERMFWEEIVRGGHSPRGSWGLPTRKMLVYLHLFIHV